MDDMEKIYSLHLNGVQLSMVLMALAFLHNDLRKADPTEQETNCSRVTKIIVPQLQSQGWQCPMHDLHKEQ